MSATNRKKQLFRCLAAGISTTLLALVASCSSNPQRYEYIHTAGVELGSNMPYTPAIKVHSGKLVFLSSVTAVPIYHSHPHVPAEFDDLSFDAGSQATLTMVNLKLTVEAGPADNFRISFN